MKTYAQAKSDILKHLATEGWQVSDASLKVPHATLGNLRLYFKAQAVYFTQGERHTLGDARTVSYDLDTRKLTCEEFVTYIARRFA